MPSTVVIKDGLLCNHGRDLRKPADNVLNRLKARCMSGESRSEVIIRIARANEAAACRSQNPGLIVAFSS